MRTENGKNRFKPYLPPDMFLSYNYLCHFSVIRRALADSVGVSAPDMRGPVTTIFFYEVDRKDTVA